MKYRKLISKVLKRRSNDGYVAVALITGLAVGAVLSVLFAPESGEDTRRTISNKAKYLRNSAKNKYAALKNKITGNDFEDHEEDVAPEIPHFTHTVTKKRKSDIKDIISNSGDTEEQQSEQPIS